MKDQNEGQFLAIPSIEERQVLGLWRKLGLENRAAFQRLLEQVSKFEETKAQFAQAEEEFEEHRTTGQFQSQITVLPGETPVATLRVLLHVSAGKPAGSQNHSNKEQVPAEMVTSDDMILVRIWGNEMQGAGIQDGAVCLSEPVDLNYKCGDIVMVRRKDETLTLNRYVMEKDDMVFLAIENPNQIIDEMRNEDVIVKGKITAFRNNEGNWKKV